MVDRLAAAIERERHLNGVASHQLRTPLAGLQLELEAALANEGTPAGPVLAAPLAQVRRLQATVDDVLTMARNDPHERSRLVDPPPISNASAAGGPGIGLALARIMAATVHGRLLLTASDPSTFTLFLPADP